jgi:putative transposase
MRAHGIRGAKRRGKPWRTTKADPLAQRRPDLVQRQFTAQEPNRLWVGDLSYLRCWEGVVYFAFVIDVFSRRVVGWQLASHMRTDLVLDALRMALGTREHGADFRLVAHTDRGSPIHLGRLHPSWTTTASWPPSARSVTRWTTRWPRASSTASRPS